MPEFPIFFSNSLQSKRKANRNLVYYYRKGLDIRQATVLFSKCRVNFVHHPNFQFSVFDGDGAISWHVPRGMIVKINCDWSWCRTLRRAGMGSVMRDSEGILLGSAIL